MTATRRQLSVLCALLAVNTVLVFLAFALDLQPTLPTTTDVPEFLATAPGWLLGLLNAGIALILYGLLGLAGFWFAGKLSLPGIYRPASSWRVWFAVPLLLGAILGVVLIVGDRVFVWAAEDWGGFPHPDFPFSILASATAGIGEEIIFRLFVLSLWAWLLRLVLRRHLGARVQHWMANVIAALAFGLGHLPSAMLLFEVSSPAEIPAIVLAEILLLNGIIGLVAGGLFLRAGLVAAVGVHFWTDVVWHILGPLVSSPP